MANEIKILQIGMGPLGVRIAQFIAARNSLKTVAAVDTNPALIGADFGPLTDTDNPNVQIGSSIEEAVRDHNPDIAILATVSGIESIAPQIEAIVQTKIPVITTCEELSYPFQTEPELTDRIDRAAKKNNVAVLATGVNPGFLMDTLPTMLTAICQQVDSIVVNRFQDAELRRLPFQRKIGAGLTLEEFEKRVNKQSLRHVGLTESIHMIAQRLGWDLDRTEDIITPVIAEQHISTEMISIARGDATGVRQTGRGYRNGRVVIELNFQAAIGEPGSYDEVKITGNPSFVSRIEGGINGDVATCAIILNAIPQVLHSSPGLKTMVDIPPVSWFESWRSES
ncbi:MAG: hypothetical protein P1V20_06805 [Verrucomicrobiales bacterium]|nr:hypothetical protein [Verrucomicrobiales bacterium]